MKARARKLKAIALAVVVLVGGLPAAQVEAVSWPIAVISAYEWGPQMRPDSAYWCGYSYSGTYGSSMFFETQSWVNYGGTCNASWGQPANKLYASMQARQGTVVLASIDGWNANNSFVSHVDLPYYALATDYRWCGEWDYTPSWFRVACRTRS